MSGGDAALTGRSLFWCKACREPVRLTGRGVLPEMRKAVHSGAGSETGPGGHAAMPTDEHPVLREQADSIECDFPGFKVTVRFGIFRATWLKHLAPPAIPVPVTARTDGELRARLAALTPAAAVIL